MKVSKLWLDKFFNEPLPEVPVLAEALTFHAFEIDGIETVGDDIVLDVKVTPNRGHDCLSHRGIAKELSAILKIPLAQDPLALRPVLAPVTTEVSVDIQTPLCKRYIAGYLKGVKVGPSPEWLRLRLEAIGQRSINNVVDATNFVMFNTGQPLHAFDAGKLGNLALGVRVAAEGEVMTALDKKEYTLNSSMLVITAGDRAVGIAGVKGGLPAAIDELTTDIVIESANFDGVSVRKTAQALKLRTDASARFEQVLSPELAAYGMRSVVELIQKIAGGELVGYVDQYPDVQKPMYANVSVEQVNRVLGAQLTGADIADVFMRLGLSYKEEAGVFEVVVPFERLDLVLAEDLIEEVARIVGYETILPAALPQSAHAPQIHAEYAAAERARAELVGRGYSEVFTSVFADHGDVVVLNKVDSVRPALRTNLIDGLTDALAKNKPNKDLLGLKEIKLFEIGTVWKDGKEEVLLGTITEKEKAAEKKLEVAVTGEYESLPLSTATRFEPFSKYPYIVRDIAMWVPSGSDAAVLLEDIQKETGQLAHKVSLFDTFTKDNRTSLAFRIIFQSFDRTLTEAEVHPLMDKLSLFFKAKGFEIR